MMVQKCPWKRHIKSFECIYNLARKRKTTEPEKKKEKKIYWHFERSFHRMNVWHFVGLGGQFITCLKLLLPPFRHVIMEQWCYAMAKGDNKTIHFDDESPSWNARRFRMSQTKRKECARHISHQRDCFQDSGGDKSIFIFHAGLDSIQCFTELILENTEHSYRHQWIYSVKRARSVDG